VSDIGLFESINFEFRITIIIHIYYYIKSVPSLNGYSYQLLCINTFYTRKDFLKVNTNFIETHSIFFFLHNLKSLKNILFFFIVINFLAFCITARIYFEFCNPKQNQYFSKNNFKGLSTV